MRLIVIPMLAIGIALLAGGRGPAAKTKVDTVPIQDLKLVEENDAGLRAVASDEDRDNYHGGYHGYHGDYHGYHGYHGDYHGGYHGHHGYHGDYHGGYHGHHDGYHGGHGYHGGYHGNWEFSRLFNRGGVPSEASVPSPVIATGT